jgi:sn-glycerol 3-phosphate transport system substrate-binding protein
MAEFFTKYPQFRTAVDQLPKTRPQDTARVYVPGGDAILGKGLERMVLNNEDAKTVWPDVKKELEKVVAQDVRPKLKS